MRIPRFLLKTFGKLTDPNVAMGIKYGKLAVTAAVYSREPVWFIPHGGTTVLVSVGSIESGKAGVERALAFSD